MKNVRIRRSLFKFLKGHASLPFLSIGLDASELDIPFAIKERCVLIELAHALDRLPI